MTSSSCFLNSDFGLFEYGICSYVCVWLFMWARIIARNLGIYRQFQITLNTTTATQMTAATNTSGSEVMQRKHLNCLPQEPPERRAANGRAAALRREECVVARSSPAQLPPAGVPGLQGAAEHPRRGHAPRGSTPAQASRHAQAHWPALQGWCRASLLPGSLSRSIDLRA